MAAEEPQIKISKKKQGKKKKVDEEMKELEQAIDRQSKDDIVHELGDVLMALASLGRASQGGQGQLLGAKTRTFVGRFVGTFVGRFVPTSGDLPCSPADSP